MTAPAHHQQIATEVATVDPRFSRTARLRPPELARVIWRRWRNQIPDDNLGRRAVRIMLDHLAKLGTDANRRMTSFLRHNVPWMDAEAQAEAIEAAFARNVFWSAADLGQALNLTFEERCAERIRTIRPFDVTPEQLKSIQVEKRNTRERERRRKQRMTKLPHRAAPQRRAEVIQALLPSGVWCDVAVVIKELQRSKSIHFANLTGSSLRPAVHRAITIGVSSGLFQVRVASGPMKPAQIARKGVPT